MFLNHINNKINIQFFRSIELKTIIQTNSEISIPDGKAGRPMSPLSENCGSCSNNSTKKGGCLFKSISFCTIKKDTRINFIKTRRIQATNVVNCRIYVMPSYKNVINASPQMNGGMGGTSMFPGMMQPQADLLGSGPASLLNNAFEEDNEANFIPMMLSSPGDSLFPNSPQPELSKIMSPQNPNNSIPSLSPFQPIQSKQQVMTTPVKNNTGQEQYVGDGLCEGYLVSVSSKNQSASKNLPETEERDTEIVKVLIYHLFIQQKNVSLFLKTFLKHLQYYLLSLIILLIFHTPVAYFLNGRTKRKKDEKIN